jgi:excinuclease ABC subunit C
MYDASGDVIYVGKAVKLCNRVSSYFRNVYHEPKVERMIERVDRFSVILCANELDALITECSLIKQHNPFYNIKLKDGHGYPFICVSAVDGCPRVRSEYSRPAGARCFGPYAYLQNVSHIVGLLNRAYKLPSCNYKPRPKPCLEYDMGRCNGFCAGKASAEEMKKAYNVLMYCSVGSEPGTLAVIERLFRTSKKVCLPLCTDLDANGQRSGDLYAMEARIIKGFDDLAPGAYGIPEPKAGTELMKPEESMVVARELM